MGARIADQRDSASAFPSACERGQAGDRTCAAIDDGLLSVDESRGRATGADDGRKVVFGRDGRIQETTKMVSALRNAAEIELVLEIAATSHRFATAAQVGSGAAASRKQEGPGKPPGPLR